MISLFAASLLVSLLGSLHCGLMCGSLAARLPAKWIDQVVFHMGRLLGYSLILLAFYGLGYSFWQSPVGSAARLVLLTLVALFFIALAIQELRAKPLILRAPALLTVFVEYLQRFARKINFPYLGRFLFGFSLAFLPCGWLWLYLLAALSLETLYLMFVALLGLWLGSIPILWLSSGFAAGLKLRTVRHARALGFLFVGLSLLLIRGTELGHGMLGELGFEPQGLLAMVFAKSQAIKDVFCF